MICTLKDKSWDFSLRWNYGSGLPLLQQERLYGQSSFNDGINSNIITENPELATYYGGVKL